MKASNLENTNVGVIVTCDFQTEGIKKRMDSSRLHILIETMKKALSRSPEKVIQTYKKKEICTWGWETI